MSTEMKKSMRRIKRPSRWEQVGIEPKTKTVANWTQDKTTVTNGDITLEVGSRIIGYEANGIADWYVLGAEDGRLLITTKSCSENVTLSGRDGYTNGVEILNNVAKKYTNSIYADGNARSINVEDVNRVTGYNPEIAGFGTNKIWQYGNEVTYYWDGSKYPYYSASNGLTGNLEYSHGEEFFYPTEGGFACSKKLTTAGSLNKQEIIKLTNTFYWYNIRAYLTESRYVTQLLFRDQSYWLGSTYVLCDECKVHFGLHIVHKAIAIDGFVNGDVLAHSHEYKIRVNCDVLPVVSLKSEVTVDSDGNITI